jgi:trigger factor
MNVTFEKKDDLNGTISVNVSNNDYTPEVDKKLKDYQKKSNIPGFRVGMAPKSMIEKMFGTSVLLEAINTTASKGLFDYIDEHKLNILGQPVLSEDTKIDELVKGQDYVFKFDVGLAPEFTLSVSENDVFTKYNVTITEAMIDDEVNRMRKRAGKLSEVEVAGDNDMVYVSMNELDENGNPIEGGVSVDSTPVLTSSIKNEALKNEFVGSTIGKSFDVNVFDLFDNDETELSHVLGINKLTLNDIGKNFHVIVKEIKRNEEAELNQEMFDSIYGPGAVSSESEFREKIKTEMKGYFDGQADHLFEHELIDTLVERQNITLPDAFLKRWLMDKHPDKFTAENVDESYHNEANYLRNHLFEEKVLSENNMQVNEDDIHAAALNYTRGMFGQYGGNSMSDEMLMSIIEPSMKKEDYRSRMINLAVSNKVREVLKQKIKLENKDVDSEAFFNIVREHNEKHHHQH